MTILNMPMFILFAYILPAVMCLFYAVWHTVSYRDTYTRGHLVGGVLLCFIPLVNLVFAAIILVMCLLVIGSYISDWLSEPLGKRKY